MSPNQRDIDAATMWWLINHEGPPPRNLIMAFARHGSGSPTILQAVEHPMADASLIEVMDYLALRFQEERADNDDDRKLVNAIDRFDEAYMWAVAWLSSIDPAARLALGAGDAS
jgi:hypothetical protein